MCSLTPDPQIMTILDLKNFPYNTAYSLSSISYFSFSNILPLYLTSFYEAIYQREYFNILQPWFYG